MLIQSCNNQPTHLKKILNTPRIIVDYLITNAPNLWKLLKYNSPQDYPYDKPDLTTAQIIKMLGNDPYVTNESVQKNILFQTNIDEAFSVGVPQVRIEIGNVRKFNPYQGYCEIYFQIVVPNKQEIFKTKGNSVMCRSDAIFCELAEALENKELPNGALCSEIFMNTMAKEGAGRTTGTIRETQNKNYSGRKVVMSALI